MAAFDTPWLDLMSKAPSHQDHGPASPNPSSDPNPPTVAAFSPTSLSGSSLTSKQRSTIIVHKKSPLLVATPPQVTRALAYSHPFLLPLNKLAGLITWSSGDPWESFLLVAGFWAVVLYGDSFIRWVGPILLVIGLILGMYSRRWSPLSSTVATEEKGHKRSGSEGVRHKKSLDEIVHTLRTFTTRCNILMDPFLEMTDFLSTQRTATTATTRPALTALFVRIVLITPLWVLLTLPPLYVITTRRVVLFSGTLFLTWHSRPARISRVILWRSRAFRWLCAAVTGFTFADKTNLKEAKPPKLPPRSGSQQHLTAYNLATKKQRGASSSGVRFTFILYENQRRWLGIGWTYSLIASERAPWTDEYLNPADPKEEFELPEVEDGNAKWRWVEGSEWRIEGATSSGKGAKAAAKDSDDAGWIYYDNKWDDGRRGQDSWGRYTRRRKWYRDAELVEVTSGDATPSNASASATPRNISRSDLTSDKRGAESDLAASTATIKPLNTGTNTTTTAHEGDDESMASKAKKRKSWFGGSGGGGGGSGGGAGSSGSSSSKKKETRNRSETSSTKGSIDSTASGRTTDDEVLDTWAGKDSRRVEKNWGLGDDVSMSLG